MAPFPRVLAVVLALALPLVSACETDCDVLCAKQDECLVLPPAEEQVRACVDQCSRDVEEDDKADEMATCASCYAAHGCEELYPADGSLGSCVGDC